VGIHLTGNQCAFGTRISPTLVITLSFANEC